MYSKQKIPRKINLGGSVGAVAGLKRIQTTARPNQTTFDPGNKITINFPSEHLYLKDSYMTFNAIATDSSVPGVNGVAFNFPISTIFTRVRVLQGSKPYCDTYDYSSWKGNLSNGWSAGLLSGQQITNFKMEGSPVLATRNTDALVDCVYACKLDLDILRQYIPAKYMSAQFSIELTLGTANQVLYDDAASVDSSYSISNVTYHYNTLDLPDDIEQKIRADVQGGGYTINYCAVSQNASTDLGTGTATNLVIPVNQQVVRRILAIVRLQTAVDDVGTDNRFRLYASNINKLTRASLKVNSDIVPADEIPELAQDAQENHWVLFRMWADAFNDFTGTRDRGYDCMGAQQWKSGSAQCLAFDLRKQPDNPEIYGNGMVLNKSGSSCVLRLAFGSAYASTAVITTFAEYESYAKITNGDVVISN
jgi:hypothetical protein